MSDEQKKPYNQAAAVSKIDYYWQLAEFEKKHRLKMDQAKRSKSKRVKKPWEELSDWPKKPSGAYNLYFIHFKVHWQQQKAEGNAQGGIMEECGLSWNAMSDEQKKPYNQAAAVSKIDYYWQLAEFEKKHPELYRHDSEEDAKQDEEDGKMQNIKTDTKQTNQTGETGGKRKRTASTSGKAPASKKHKPNETATKSSKEPEKTEAKAKDKPKEKKDEKKADRTEKEKTKSGKELEKEKAEVKESEKFMITPGKNTPTEKGGKPNVASTTKGKSSANTTPTKPPTNKKATKSNQ